MSKELGDFINYHRKEAGLTQVEFHNAIIDVAQIYEFPTDMKRITEDSDNPYGSPQVSRWENGHHTPQPIKRKFISKILDVPYEEIEKRI